MSDESKTTADPTNLLQAWIETASEFLGTMLASWSDAKPAPSPTAAEESAKRGRAQESFESVLKTWQTLSTVAGDPGAHEAVSNLGHVVPGIVAKMVQSGWQAFFDFQQQWLERSGRIGTASTAYSFENPDEETFRAWSDIYEKEFRQFYTLPQLGLTRVYQEKFNDALDKHNRFQAAFAEFMHVFLLPMEKSLSQLQEELARMAEEGSLPDDANAYYKMWIKNLEGRYMQLYQSPEYLRVMNNTLGTLVEFLSVRQAVTNDVLKAMAVPTQTDMDELYKEIYQLKKRIRMLEKQI
jgi:class III poly(R)-hydroxyalkanoic acid synthase PhaE subunit